MIDPTKPGISVHQHRILYGDSDQMGIVYHPNYLKYLEIGRIEYLRDCGYSYANLEKNGIRIPVIRVEIDYKAPARFDELIDIQTTMESVSRIRVVFNYTIFNQNTELIARAKTQHAFTNQRNELSRVQQTFVEALQGLGKPVDF
ncbi:MAG: acyl-CoA thioesterase [Sumerlaeia bacterium]